MCGSNEFCPKAPCCDKLQERMSRKYVNIFSCANKGAQARLQLSRVLQGVDRHALQRDLDIMP